MSSANQPLLRGNSGSPEKRVAAVPEGPNVYRTGGANQIEAPIGAKQTRFQLRSSGASDPFERDVL